MKYLKYLVFIFLLLIPLNVRALSVQLYCTPSIKAGSDFICTIYGPEHCSEISMVLKLPDGFTYANVLAGKNYNSIGNGTSLSFTGNGLHERTLAVVTIKAPSPQNDTSYTISLNNIKYKYESTNANYYSGNDISQRVSVLANAVRTTTTTKASTQSASNNYVVTLVSDDETQSLSCTPINGKCEINLSNANTPVKSSYIFSGWNKTKNCTSGETGTYTLTSDLTLYACFDERKENDTIPYLKALEIEGFKLNFSKFLFEYNITTDKLSSELVVNATPAEDGAKVNVEIVDDHTITVQVTSEHGQTKYYINLVSEPTSEISKVLNISLGKYTIDFNPDIYEYNVIIDAGKSFLDISVNLSQEYKSYEVEGNENLKTGSVITVTLADENGETINYKFNIVVQTFLEKYRNYIILGAILLFLIFLYIFGRSFKKSKLDASLPERPKRVKKEKPKKEKTKKLKKNKNPLPEPEQIITAPPITPTETKKEEEIETL